MSALRFLLNGEPREVRDAPPHTTLLDWLRGSARLTGTKEGCAEGDCGACTVLLARRRGGGIEYQAVNSCLLLLPQIDGCAVTTVEGVSAPGEPLHPVQQALVDADATQCGFCTPGFVMTMLAFQQGGEAAQDVLIHEALAGNLCRCTGYRSIVDACRKVAGTSAPLPRDAGAFDALQGHEGCGDYRFAKHRFLAPERLGDFLALVARQPEALVWGGGTDLGLRASKGREAFPLIISTARVTELQQLGVQGDALKIGGAVTYTKALPHLDRYFPEFGALVRRIGSRQIRNLGTLAGNLATASPIGDTLPCLIALGASVTLLAQTGSRTLLVEDFITGYRRTALAQGEIIGSIHIPFVPAGQRFSAYKISKRFDQDIATVVAAFRVELMGTSVMELHAAFGGMAARVQRAAQLEAGLPGRAWEIDALGDVDALLARDFSPLSDHRGSAAYRLRAAAGLVRRFCAETAAATPIMLEAL